MIRAITYLCLLLVLCISIDYNHAATTVFYQFVIREVPKIRNETDRPGNSTNVETEEIITGWRGSDFQTSDNETADSGEGIIYGENAEFTHDENGYHVKYRVKPDVRLGSTTLKVLTG